MTEPQTATGAGAGAGAMLRAARERQGLHVAALAAAIKIPQRKLEALEAGRYDELPDATFTRALAMTVCRALKIDAVPVLAQLPQAGGNGLSAAAGGLNAPFRDRPGRAEPAELSPLRHPLSWAALAVLVAAATVFLLPSGWWEGLMPGSTPLPTPAPAAPASAVQSASSAQQSASAAAQSLAAAPMEAVPMTAASAASAPMVEVVHSVPGAEAGASAVADIAAGLAVLRATDATWVEVVDAGGQVLVQRQLQPGESLGLNGKLPFKLKIGNAAATQLQFRGQGVDLAPVTRDNVARLELK
jgi:cytoskeleton protein RodZ